MATCREGETGHGITAVTTREGKEKTEQDETEELEDAEHKGFSGAHVQEVSVSA